MKKLLYFNVPAFGHVNATLPVVRELTTRGHTVICYNASTFANVIEPTKATFRPYPNSEHMEAELSERASNLPTVTVGLLQESFRLLPFVLNELENEAPDVVLFDALAIWGMQAAILKQMPTIGSITTFFMEGAKGFVRFSDYWHLLGRAIGLMPKLIQARRKLVKAYGTAVFPHNFIIPAIGDKTISFSAQSFHPHSPLIDKSFHFVGPSIQSESRVQTNFPWYELDQSRPKIYLSLGTLYNDRADFYTAVFNAFKNHPAQFILSLGKRIQLSNLPAIPSNFIVQPTIPQVDLLPKIDLFITHGGLNSVNEALYFGVPMVVVPQQLEQAINGRFVAQKGVGIVLKDSPPYGQVDIETVSQAVEQVLNSPSFKAEAEKMRQAFQSAGGYQKAADIILA